MIRAAARVMLTQLTASSQDPLVRYIADRGHLLLTAPLPPGGIRSVRALVGVGEHDTVTPVDENRAVVTCNRYAKNYTDHGIAVRAIHLDHFEERARQAKPWLERVHNGQAISTEAGSVMLGTAAEGQDILLAHPLLHPMAAVIAEALRLPCIGICTVATP